MLTQYGTNVKYIHLNERNVQEIIHVFITTNIIEVLDFHCIDHVVKILTDTDGINVE